MLYVCMGTVEFTRNHSVFRITYVINIDRDDPYYIDGVLRNQCQA